MSKIVKSCYDKSLRNLCSTYVVITAKAHSHQAKRVLNWKLSKKCSKRAGLQIQLSV